MAEIFIRFENKEAQKHFEEWFMEDGEHHYHAWMASKEREEVGDITAVNFTYHYHDVSTLIDTDCSRLDSTE